MLLRYRRQESVRRKRTIRACRVRPDLCSSIWLCVGGVQSDVLQEISVLLNYMVTDAEHITWSGAGDVHFQTSWNMFVMSSFLLKPLNEAQL